LRVRRMRPSAVREALLDDRRPQDIAALLLKRLAMVGRDGDVGVQVEALAMSLARSGRGDQGCRACGYSWRRGSRSRCTET
jgi:hypothetical protein